MAVINFCATLRGFNGEIIPETPAPGSPNATLGKVCTTALQALQDGKTPSGKELTPAEKWSRFQLMQMIDGNASCHLTAEDVTTLKDAVGQVYGVNVMGAAWSLLDPPADVPQDDQE